MYPLPSRFVGLLLFLLTAQVATQNHRKKSSEQPCEWPRPPINGLNYMRCGDNTCEVKRGAFKPHGIIKLTECKKGYYMSRGELESQCSNGTWVPPDSHKCEVCGRSQLDEVALIHHGKNASRGSFPWQAGLYLRNAENRWSFACGGTLISDHVVLTAAHCVKLGNSTLVKAKDIQVTLGKLLTDLYTTEPSTVVTDVREVVVQSRYIGLATNHILDIALLDLETTMPSSRNIMPACVDWADTVSLNHGDKGYLAGYGVTEENVLSVALKWSRQSFVQYSNCVKNIGPDHVKLLTPDKFCTSTVEGAKADFGDSGGGLTFSKDDTHYVKGVVSTKIPKEKHEEDVVLFTNVVKHKEWLLEHWNSLRVPGRRKISQVLDPTDDVDIYRKIECGISQLDEAAATLHNMTASRGSFPWQTIIYLKNKGEWVFRCGGTLVSTHIMLTAAQCVTFKNSTVIPARDIKVGLGKLLSDYHVEESSAVITDVKEVVVPYRYSGRTGSYSLDIALLDLETAVPSSPYIMPACLDWDSEMSLASGGKGYLATFGRIRMRGVTELKWSRPIYVDNPDCWKKLDNENQWRVISDKVCATGEVPDKSDLGDGLTFTKDDIHFVQGVMNAAIIDNNEEVALLTNVMEHKEWLLENWNRLTTRRKSKECGISQLDEFALIHRGKNASVGSFPWQAAFFVKDRSDKFEFRCGATLITEHVVMTAAGCVNSYYKIEDLRVAVGKLLTDFEKQEPLAFITKVREIIVPERVDMGKDLAMLDLETVVPTSRNIMPACVDWKKTMTITVGDKGYLAGYGKSEYSASSRDYGEPLKWSRQSYVTYPECLKALPFGLGRIMTADKFCTITAEGAKTDYGDSGSGVTFVQNGAHFVHGVMSTNIPQHEEDEFNIVLFTSVQDMKSWMLEHLRRLKRA